MIDLNVDRKEVQLVGNVDNLMASINHHYHINHSEKMLGGEHGFSFGKHPICEHRISYYGGRAELVITKIKGDLIKKITGKTPIQICEEVERLTKEENYDKANKYISSFSRSLEDYFNSDAVSLDTNSGFCANIDFTINIGNLTDDVLNAISEVLINSELISKSQSNRTYDIAS